MPYGRDEAIRLQKDPEPSGEVRKKPSIIKFII